VGHFRGVSHTSPARCITRHTHRGRPCPWGPCATGGCSPHRSDRTGRCRTARLGCCGGGCARPRLPACWSARGCQRRRCHWRCCLLQELQHQRGSSLRGSALPPAARARCSSASLRKGDQSKWLAVRRQLASRSLPVWPLGGQDSQCGGRLASASLTCAPGGL
jgi:hypothetical protein